MINPEDEIILDLSTSCTKEVAAAKLLGWMKGPRRLKVIEVTESGISGESLPYYSFEGSLDEQLQELREAAFQELIAAAEEDADFEELEEKHQAYVNAESLIDNAHRYLSDIDLELSKGNDSLIKIDQVKTDCAGVQHVYLSSLDKWAKQQYDISIFEDLKKHLTPEEIESKALENEDDYKLKYDPKGSLSPTRSRTLFTIFGFLVEDYVKRAPNKFGEDEPTVDAISKHIENLAIQACKPKKPPRGLGHENINNYIEEAMTIKKERMPQRKK